MRSILILATLSIAISLIEGQTQNVPSRLINPALGEEPSRRPVDTSSGIHPMIIKMYELSLKRNEKCVKIKLRVEVNQSELEKIDPENVHGDDVDKLELLKKIIERDRKFLDNFCNN